VTLVPSSFRAQPRWKYDEAGRVWLNELPELVAHQCFSWSLSITGAPMHGSNALVLPVSRRGEPYVLRLSPPGDDIAAEARALRVWDGRGTVRLIEADESNNALLLERLDGWRSLTALPVLDAIEVLAELTRTLAVPVPADVTSTTSIAAELVDRLEQDWLSAGRPAPRIQLDVALGLAADRAAAKSEGTAVNGDLHFEQVLRATREPWLVVDPVLLRGDREYDIGRALWTRLDELTDEHAVMTAFERFVRTSGVPEQRAHAWVVLRSMSYLLWGIPRGFTEDPVRCRRLLDLFC
jgi:streptomycin 6-kinase